MQPPCQPRIDAAFVSAAAAAWRHRLVKILDRFPPARGVWHATPVGGFNRRSAGCRQHKFAPRPSSRATIMAVVANTASGAPAAAQTWAKPQQRFVQQHNRGCQVPDGGNAADGKAGGVAHPGRLRPLNPAARAARAIAAVSTRCAPDAIASTGRPLPVARKISDLAMAPTGQPTARAAVLALVQVDWSKRRIVSGWPAASRAARTRPTEPPWGVGVGVVMGEVGRVSTPPPRPSPLARERGFPRPRCVPSPAKRGRGVGEEGRCAAAHLPTAPLALPDANRWSVGASRK